MSELHKFLFEGLPVRGMLVRLTDTWQDILARRAQSGAYEPALRDALSVVDVPANRSWRPFQLAFILQCLPSLTDPAHPERSRSGLSR